MMRIVAALALAFLWIPSAAAQAPEDESALRSLVAALDAAWAAGDGDAWGAQFTEDADFTVWFGLHMKGRSAIARGHQGIFEGIYADTRLTTRIQDIRMLSPDIASMRLDMRVTDPGGAESNMPEAVHPAIAVDTGSGWKITAFQNTPYLPPGQFGSGDIRNLKAAP